MQHRSPICFPWSSGLPCLAAALQARDINCCRCFLCPCTPDVPLISHRRQVEEHDHQPGRPAGL